MAVLIPHDTDVLITHGPPMAILDYAHGEHVGCADLWKRVTDIAPKVHAFGHIHEGSGVEDLRQREHLRRPVQSREPMPNYRYQMTVAELIEPTPRDAARCSGRHTGL